MKQDPLAGLHDIHLPEPVSWWPPAPGWWMLLGLVLLIIAALFWWWLQPRKQQRKKPQQFSQRDMIDQALSELDALQHPPTDNRDQRIVVADLSALLRRVAMRLTSDDASIAGLNGDAWLIWLDDQWDKDAFARGAGRPLLDAPFQRDGPVDIDALLQISRDWLEAQR